MIGVALLRRFRSGRGVAVMAVTTLALGVAALTTTFGVVHAALVRLPPFRDADRLALLFLERNPAGEPPRQERWSFARFERLRATQQSFSALASFSPASVTLAADGDAELVYSERVSASYFDVLGVAPISGRLFDDGDDDPARPSPVAVIAHSLWSARFGADPNISGRTIRLNGVPLTVIGVLPAGFSGLSGRAAVWMPRTMSARVTYAEYVTTNQNFIAAIGRLRDGVSLDAADSELRVLGAAINRALPSDPDHPDERVTASAMSLNGARADVRVRRSLLVLLGAVALLHLLACANVINLLLGQTAARQREFAVRTALGVTRGRLFKDVFVDGLAVAAIAGAAGLLLAYWATSLVAPPASSWAALTGHVAPFDTPAFSAVHLVFGAIAAVLTAVLVAMPPAMLAARRADTSSGLRAGSRSVADAALSLRRPTMRGVIVSVEAALAALLVIAAGLFLDSFQRMRRADIGVNVERVLSFWVVPSEARVPPAIAPAFVSRLVERLQRVPGVESVSVDGGAPLSGSASSTLFIEGQPLPAVGQAPLITRHYVAPDHFKTLGIPLLRGRAFAITDTATSPRVAVISDSARRRFWPNENPIGRRVWFGGGSAFDSPERTVEIVGVVGDVLYQPFDRPANLASFYTAFTQFTYAARMVFLRTHVDPMAVLPEVRRAVASVDPELALQDVTPLADLVDGSWARRRFDTVLFSGFGLVALVLAATGIFAVLAYSVERRRREFGIRIALGAGRGRVIRHVLREGLAFPVVGILAGFVAAVAFTRVMQSSLYETSAKEPRVFAVISIVLLAAAALACLGPAWRATRADPIESLRAE